MEPKEIINDLLINEKHLVYVYSAFLNEASNNNIYQEVLSLIKESSEQKNRLFEIMLANNWYQLEKADETKINQKHTKSQEDFNQLQ